MSEIPVLVLAEPSRKITFDFADPSDDASKPVRLT